MDADLSRVIIPRLYIIAAFREHGSDDPPVKTAAAGGPVNAGYGLVHVSQVSIVDFCRLRLIFQRRSKNLEQPDKIEMAITQAIIFIYWFIFNIFYFYDLNDIGLKSSSYTQTVCC